jgi:hypothetical protein
MAASCEARQGATAAIHVFLQFSMHAVRNSPMLKRSTYPLVMLKKIEFL